MRSRVVDFPKKAIQRIPEERTSPVDPMQPMSILHALYGLWSARVICQDAFFLGAQVCHRMQVSGSQQAVMTGEQAQRHLTRLDGSIYSGPIGKSLSTYVAALQDLHFRGGLLNDLGEPRLFDPSQARTHFTLSPTLTAGRHYSFQTPIHFRIIQLDKADFFESANRLAAAALGDCKPLDLTE